MSRAAGFVSGILTLTALEVVLGSTDASGRVGGLLAGAGSLVRRAASPDIAAIPDLAHTTAPASTGPAVYEPPPQVPPASTPLLAQARFPNQAPPPPQQRLVSA